MADALERPGRRRPARARYPKVRFWASAKEGIDQVGRVYAVKRFEFDYVGVICGPDLVYRPMDGGWVGQRHESRDSIVSRGVTDVEFTAFVTSTYRVLLTRGLRGCYVYIIDAPTRDFLSSRTERPHRLKDSGSLTADQAG